MKSFALSLSLVGLVCATTPSTHAPKKPRIVGEWWQVAGNPDLGELNNAKQQPVDFGIWQATDGRWQLWSCIRYTKAPGRSRVFYRWEGAKLTDANWTPMGIAMRADPKVGELEGGLQAPFVFQDGNRFVMYYGSWNDICSATSADGKSFTRITNPEGKVALFGAATGNTRDPMVIRIGERWHCYYTAHPENKGAVYCRTSTDLKAWTEPRLVARGGQSGDGPYSSECPFVVELAPGQYYLFRTQKYGTDAKTSVYFSRDPLDFGIVQDDGHFVGTLPVAAPEIIRHEKQWFVAALMPSLKGIQIAKLAWD